MAELLKGGAFMVTTLQLFSCLNIYRIHPPPPPTTQPISHRLLCIYYRPSNCIQPGNIIHSQMRKRWTKIVIGIGCKGM